MQKREKSPEVCDATGLDSSNEDWYIKNFLNVASIKNNCAGLKHFMAQV